MHEPPVGPGLAVTSPIGTLVESAALRRSASSFPCSFGTASRMQWSRWSSSTCWAALRILYGPDLMRNIGAGLAFFSHLFDSPCDWGWGWTALTRWHSCSAGSYPPKGDLPTIRPLQLSPVNPVVVAILREYHQLPYEFARGEVCALGQPMVQDPVSLWPGSWPDCLHEGGLDALRRHSTASPADLEVYTGLSRAGHSKQSPTWLTQGKGAWRPAGRARGGGRVAPGNIAPTTMVRRRAWSCLAGTGLFPD